MFDNKFVYAGFQLYLFFVVGSITKMREQLRDTHTQKKKPNTKFRARANVHYAARVCVCVCVYSVECDTIATAEFGGRRTRPARPVAAVQLAGASAKIHTLAAAQRRLNTARQHARCTMEPECVHTHTYLYTNCESSEDSRIHTHTPTLNLDEPAAAASLLRLRHSVTRGRLLLLLGLVYIFFCVRARIDFGVFSSLLDVCIPPHAYGCKVFARIVCVLCVLRQ